MVESNNLVSLDDIRGAARLIAPHIHRTPVTSSAYLGGLIGATLYLKLEMFQKTGSFKPRGVLTKMASLDDEEKRRGVVSLSAGNHAQALAYAATMAGAPSVIVMPSGAVRAKIEATRGYGGEVVLTDDDLLQTALDIERERGMTLVHPFDDLNTIAGKRHAGTGDTGRCSADGHCDLWNRRGRPDLRSRRRAQAEQAEYQGDRR